MPGMVLTSERVFTGLGSEARPLAVVVEGPRIEAVVPRGEADSHVDATHPLIDLADSFVCAGFHDAHQHVFHAALFPSAIATEYPGCSEADCVAHMRQFAETRPGSGWLVSHGWRDMLWDIPKAPTRDSLDEAFPDRPVAMYSGDSHTLWTNSVGLAWLGITDDTEPPVGGSFDRDAEGHLTGVLREAAGMTYVARVLSSLPAGEVERAYRDYFGRMLSQGVTSLCDMGLSALPGADGVNEGIYEQLLAEGGLSLRMHLFPSLTGDMDRLEGMQERMTGDLLRAPGFKQFFDGVSSAHTAWLSEPYANPRFPGDCGRPTVPPERMRELVLAAAERGHAVRVHTIGDRAIHEAIAIFREARERFGSPTQGANSLEHLENLLTGDVAGLAEAHLVASVQPQHIVIDCSQPDRDLGATRASFMWPFASYLAAGVPMAFGSDAPCVEPRAMDVLSCAVSRTDPVTGLPEGGWLATQRIPMVDAIRAFTLGSAVVVGRADEMGTIEPGRLADLAAFDRDLMACPPCEFRHVRTRATYVGGRLAFEA